MIKDLFALPLPFRVRKRPSLTDSPETKEGAALGRRAGSFSQANRKHVTFLKINDTVLSYVLATIIWSGELLHKDKLKNRRCEIRTTNLVPISEPVVEQHLFRGKKRESESWKAPGPREMPSPAPAGERQRENRAPRRLGPACPGLARELSPAPLYSSHQQLVPSPTAGGQQLRALSSSPLKRDWKPGSDSNDRPTGKGRMPGEIISYESFDRRVLGSQEARPLPPAANYSPKRSFYT